MTKVQSFDEWMRTKVQSVYYSNNEEMDRAYRRLEENEKGK